MKICYSRQEYKQCVRFLNKNILIKEHVDNLSDLNNTTMMATTQTALLLAEMDEDLKEKSCDMELDVSKNESDLNATGFILTEDTEVNIARVSFGYLCAIM